MAPVARLFVPSALDCPLRDSNPHRNGFRGRRSAIELRGPGKELEHRSAERRPFDAAAARRSVPRLRITCSTPQTIFERHPRQSEAVRRLPASASVVGPVGRPPRPRRPRGPPQIDRTATPPSGRSTRTAPARVALSAGRSRSVGPVRRERARGVLDCAAACDTSAARPQPGAATVPRACSAPSAYDTLRTSRGDNPSGCDEPTT